MVHGGAVMGKSDFIQVPARMRNTGKSMYGPNPFSFKNSHMMGVSYVHRGNMYLHPGAHGAASQAFLIVHVPPMPFIPVTHPLLLSHGMYRNQQMNLYNLVPHQHSHPIYLPMPPKTTVGRQGLA